MSHEVLARVVAVRCPYIFPVDLPKKYKIRSGVHINETNIMRSFSRARQPRSQGAGRGETLGTRLRARVLRRPTHGVCLQLCIKAIP